MDSIDALEKEIALAEGAKKIELRIEQAFKLRMTNPQKSSQQALKAYEEALSAKDTKLELRALLQICTSGLYDKNFKDPGFWIDKLAERGIALNHNVSIGRSYMMKYRWSYQAGKLSEAAEYLIKALEFFNTEQNSPEVASCYNGLGNINYELKNYDKALEYYNQTLLLVKEKSSSSYLLVKQNIGIIQLMKHDYVQAWESFHEILDDLPVEEIGTRRLVLINLSHICHKTSEYEQSLEYIDQVIKLSEDNLPEHSMIRPLCNKGLVLSDMKDYERAIKCFSKAEKLALKSDNLADHSEVYQAMTVYYKKINKLEELVKYHEKLLEVTRKLNQSDQGDQVNKFETQHQINLYKEKSLMLEERNKLAANQNENLQESMNKLLSREKDLETKLKNAFKTINKKDDLLAAHHRLASIGEMITIIAHQWKQPLSIINSMVFSIKDAYHFDELTEEIIDEKVKMIDDLIQYLSQTMNDFRNFFKEQNNIDFKASVAVNGAVSLLKYALDLENVSMNLGLENDFYIHGSQNELIQVFLNLINNARDAFKEENIPQPVVKISLEMKTDHYLISFYNNGGPIPEKLSDKIFEAYVSSKGKKGTGLGLNICQTIIEDRFKGKIYFQNTLDGVTFYIELPLKNN